MDRWLIARTRIPTVLLKVYRRRCVVLALSHKGILEVEGLNPFHFYGSVCYRTAPGSIEGDIIFISILLLLWFCCGTKRRSRRDTSAGVVVQRQVCLRTKVFLVVSIQMAQLEEPFVASGTAGALSAKLPRSFSFI
jgi:hypothetical protein